MIAAGYLSIIVLKLTYIAIEAYKRLNLSRIPQDTSSSIGSQTLRVLVPENNDTSLTARDNTIVEAPILSSYISIKKQEHELSQISRL